MVTLRKAADPDFAVVYDLAMKWRDGPLTSGGSLFDHDRPVWQRSTADDLNRRFVEQADMGDRTFAEKLQDQLSGADQATHLLMAELMLMHLLPLVNISMDTKLRNIDAIGSWAPEPFVVPEAFHPALDRGIFNGGAGFNTNRPQLLVFFIRLVRRWTVLDADQRRELLGDPWKFKDLLLGTDGKGVDSQRNALLLMLFPATFEDISSNSQKRRIVQAFAGEAGTSSDVDRQLLTIRKAKSGEFGEDFSWFNADVRPQWDIAPAKPNRRSAVSTPHEALVNAIASEADRRAVVKLMADAIRTAHDVNPQSWSVSFRDNGVRLNVGPNRTISIAADEVGFTVGSVEPLTDAVKISVDADNPYAFPPGTYYHRVSSGDLVRVAEASSGSLMETVRQTAVRNTPYWGAHSPDAVQAVGEIAGVELPEMPQRNVVANSGQQAFVVRMKKDGRTVTAGALERSDARIFWPLDVAPGSTLDEIKAGLRARDPEASNHVVGNQAGSIYRFISRMKPGDVVLMPDGGDLYLGIVDGGPVFDSAVQEWIRPVEWTNVDTPVSRGDVSSALHSRLQSLLTVSDVTDSLLELLELIGSDESAVSTSSANTVAGHSQQASFPPITEAASRDWMLDHGWLQEILDLLRARRQLIFYGPPGTGKTYLAQQLADHITADESGTYKLVQFHPSYSYEDFVEGFRPQVDESGSLTYELAPGPLKLMAEAARQDPGGNYLLLIDEINRGNLAKIFGELYYLLEYRDRTAVLQYGSSDGDEFSLPKNFYVIGTMNTADRSIAVVDAAIRRRFGFVEFSPTKKPISDLLRTWLTRRSESTEPADILDELNRRLTDDDYAIGPSYLINDDALTEEGMDRIWKHGIMPLLEEQFYGQAEALGHMSLAGLRQSVRRDRVNTAGSRTDIVGEDEGTSGKDRPEDDDSNTG